MLKSLLIMLLALCSSLCLAATGDVRFASFENDTDMQFTGSNVEVSRVERNASDGKFSLMMPIKGSATDSWPGLVYTPKDGADWSAYQTMKMDVFVDGTKSVNLGVRLDTKQGTGWLYSLQTLQPGWNRNWTIPINDVRDTADLHHITTMWLGESCPREDATVYFDNVRLGPFEFGFKKIIHLETFSGIKANAEETKQGFMLFSTPYGSLVFPNTKPRNRISSASIFLAQGEKEPLVINLQALKDLDNITAAVSTLKGPNGTEIVPSNWDVRIVRHKDKRENYQVDSYIVDIPTYLTVPDSPEKLASGKTASFWLTMTAPAKAQPGVYKGSVDIIADGVIRKIPLSVRVLPFMLPELSGDLHGVYYRTFGKGMATRDQITFDLADMRAHGMNSLGLCIGVDASSYKVDGETVTFDFKGDTSFEYIMDAYKDLGFPESIVMLADTGQEAAHKHPYASESYARTYTNFWVGLDKACKSKGWKSMYIQPEDEVGWRTAADRERNTYLLGLLKKAGLMTEVDGPSDAYFNNEAGPLSDVWNYNGIIGPEDVVTKALKGGKLITVYNFDSSGFTPEVQRWARGLFNWKHGLRGSFNWEYRGGNGSIFDDQDAQLGDWVHYYPPYEGKPGGPSTGWEGSREGIDDRKYISLLEFLIRIAPSLGKQATECAKQASATLAQLKNQLTSHPDSTTNRIVWENKIQPADALKLGYIKEIDPEVAWYYAGDLKLPNGLPLATYNNIRWLIASETVKLLSVMSKASPLPKPAAGKPIVVKNRIVKIEKSDGKGAWGAYKAGRPTVIVPVLDAVPVLDGIVDDAGWKKAAKVSLTLSNGTGKPLGATDVMFGIHGSILYVAFICSEDRANDIVAKVLDHGGPVWEDDCVEVFIDSKRSGSSFHQVVANSLGTTYQIGPEGAEWTADIKAAGKVDIANRKWICEIAIPLDDMKIGPSIGLNFARERRPLNILELSSWAVTGDTFRKPELFGIATLPGNVQGAVNERIRPELKVKFDQPVTETHSRLVNIDVEPVLDDTDLAKAHIVVKFAGNGKSFQTDLGQPLTDHMRVTIDVGDLPAGNYAVKALLNVADKTLANWQGVLLRTTRE